MLGGESDRFPFFDLEPSDDTVRLWRRQGLPTGVSVAEHFDLEPHHDVGLVLRSAPFYRKAPDLLTDPASFSSSSTKRSMVAGAEFVCTVAKIRIPKLAS